MPQLEWPGPDALRLCYVETGTGDPLVFVHGAFSDQRVWAPQLDGLSGHARCIALTMRHFGASSALPPGSYSMATHAADLAAFIDRLAPGGAHVVASSYGAAVALACALAGPGRCLSLCLNEPALPSLLTTPAEQQVARAARRELAPVAAASTAGDLRSAVEAFCDWTAFAGAFATLSPALKAMFHDNAHTLALHLVSPPPTITPADLLALRLPVTYVLGSRSNAYFRAIVQAAQRHTPGSELHVVDGTHHGTPFERHQAFDAIVVDHLRRARAASGA